MKKTKTATKKSEFVKRGIVILLVCGYADSSSGGFFVCFVGGGVCKRTFDKSSCFDRPWRFVQPTLFRATHRG